MKVETAKEKVIREAYGEYWEILPEGLKIRIISNNGSLDYFILPRDERYNTEKICDIRSDKSIFECIGDDEGTPRYFRPKSLNGIENNNGWIKIESEEYLPKEPDFYWCRDNNGTIHQIHYEDIVVGYSTHWQSINRPQPPIY